MAFAGDNGAGRVHTSTLTADIVMGNSGAPSDLQNAGEDRMAGVRGVEIAQRAMAVEQDRTMTQQLQQMVLLQRETIRPGRTKDQQEPRVMEHFQYAKHAFPLDINWSVPCFAKIFRFMWHQCMREEKPRGGAKESRQKRKEGIYFDVEDYKKVMKNFSECVADAKCVPQPEKPCGAHSFDQYKAVIRKIYRVQVAQGVLKENNWDGLWTAESLNELYRFVKERKPLAAKAAYKEKIDGEFAPCAICNSYDDIEAKFWGHSDDAHKRTICKALRHRCIFLLTTSGILRTESLCRGELSDYLGFWTPKLDTDVDNPHLMVGQTPIGKTTHGRKQYIRCSRHRDVKLCGMGAFAFYLAHRFHVTEEFHDKLDASFWKENSNWFDIKALIDCTGHDRTVSMSNNSYAKHMKKTLDELGLSCDKLLHKKGNTTIIDI